jgi:hypothetical protein
MIELCKYRGICKKLLFVARSNGFKNREFLDQWSFNLEYSQNFGPCNTRKPQCPLYYGHEAARNITNNELTHIELMAKALENGTLKDLR